MAAPAPAPTIVAAVLPLPLPIWLPMTPPTTAPVAALAVRFSVQAEVVSASNPAKNKVKYLSFIVSNSRYPLLLQMERYIVSSPSPTSFSCQSGTHAGFGRIAEKPEG
jgi:hypothetical protein